MKTLIAAATLALLATPTFAEDVAPPETCGDLANDNRPNICQQLIGEIWTKTYSTCEKISDTEFKYTSCSGASMTMTGNDLTCLEGSECKGAYYIGVSVP